MSTTTSVAGPLRSATDRARVASRRLDPLRTDRAAHVTLGMMTVVAIGVYVWLGSSQWFIRDDWAFALTRNLIRDNAGWRPWLFEAQDGHWMTAPILLHRATHLVFGLGSYWPFLAQAMLMHLGTVFLVHRLCHRVGVTAWTSTVVCSLLLLFGNGWENILFAVQTTYNLSLLAFLAQLLLVDHDGPVDRRDWFGVAIGTIGLMSSAFGPFFAAGVFLLLVLRRRWTAAAVAVGPQAFFYSWWLFTYGNDPAGASGDPTISGALQFARLTFTATLTSLTGQVIFAGAALLGIVAMTTWRRLSYWRRTLLFTLAFMPVPIFLAIGWQRAVFGLESAASSRYQYMVAMLVATPFALAVDQLRRFSPGALVIGRLLLVVSILTNVRFFEQSSDMWAGRSSNARATYELIAGSDLMTQVDPNIRPVEFDPDVTVGRIPIMVAEGVITPRTPTTPEEIQLVRTVLGLPPAP
jgi:hypothetical protein